MKALWRRLGWLLQRSRYERELDEELHHHLALKAEEQQSREAAHRQFGNVAVIREDSRAMWTFVFWEQLAQDVRYGLRAMASNKLFTAMAALSLALGIGANTAIFSFLDAVLLRSLPVRQPSELAVINWSSHDRAPLVHGVHGSMFREAGRGRVSPNFPFALWDLLRENKDAAASVFAYAHAYQLNLIAHTQAEVVHGLYVSSNFFDGLGVRPAAGRLIGGDDDLRGSAPVAVISWNYWKTRFASNDEALGQTISINNKPFTIVGVSAPGFYGVDSGFDPSVFLPLHNVSLLAQHPAEEEKHSFGDKNFYWLEMMARLRPGITMSQAQSAFNGIYHRFAMSTAATEKERKVIPELWLEDGAGGLDGLRRQYSKPLYILMAMVGLILVIACANIANLLLARSAARRREMAIRLSLGAGRMRVIRQLLTESALLALLGGGLGVVVALQGIRSILWLLGSGREDFVLRASLDLPVLAFTFTLALITGMVFGLAPALQSTGGNAAPALKESRIGGMRGQGRIGLTRILVVSQITLSLVLAVAAGLFVRTLVNLHSVNLGFNRERILLFSLNATQAGYKEEALGRFYAALGDRFRATPGVESAGLSEFPLASGYWTDNELVIPGSQTAVAKRPSVSVMKVDQAFLPTMHIPILLGRQLDARDISSPRVAIVTDLFVKKFFPGESPVGHLIGFDKGTPDVRIVGVAQASRYNSLKEAETPPVAYIPFTQDPADLGQVYFELRTTGDPLLLANTVRRIVHEASPSVPVSNLDTQAGRIDQTIGQERTFAGLCTCFAILALVIACVGLYGTMAYMVARRTSEIGIRVALGAGRRRIVWMVLREVLAMAGVGLTIGLIVAWQTAHFVASFLFGIKPNDPWAMLGSAAILTGAALAAGYAPAWRAARIDPMVALRHD